MKIGEIIAEELAKFYGVEKEKAIVTVSESRIGDYTSTLAFVLAKEKNLPPQSIAEEFHTNHPFIERIEAKNGYINFYLSEKYYESLANTPLQKPPKKGKKVIIEFPSVNPNKPWHIGHLRNALLGNAISNIYEWLGYDVVRMDYIDDLGLQFAQSLYSYLYINNKVEGKLDHWLGKEYVKIAKLMEENEEVERGVRELLAKMEKGMVREGRELAEACVKAQYETAFKYDVFHDVLVFESDIVRDIFEEGLKMLKENASIYFVEEGKNKGCYVFNLEGEEKVLIRSDGTATYTGKDVIFALWKFGLLPGLKFHPFVKQPNGKIAYASGKEGEEMNFSGADIVINVIGIEQTFPQQVIKAILERFGKREYYHLAYAHVRLREGRFSGRKGTWIGYTADELFEEGLKRIENKEIAKPLINAAVKFAFLKVHPTKEVLFDWDIALSTEGDSGVYLLYSYVRARNILKKLPPFSENNSEYKYNEDERRLLRKISLFGDVVEEAAKKKDPHVLAVYLLEIAKLFHSFYAKYPVIKDEKAREKRKKLVERFVEVMKEGLSLLGIGVLEKM